MFIRDSALGLSIVWGCCVFAGHPANTFAASSPDDFYQGKQIAVYVGYGPGGSYDTCARLLARHMGDFIPGNPKFIVQNRPGAGSISLANQIYATVPRDGTVIGTIGDILVIKQMLGEPGIAFVAAEFNWIGRLDLTDGIFVVRPDVGIASIDDARKKQITIGVPGAGSATALDLLVLNNLLGTKFKLISGYNSGTEVKLALERGEVEGMGSVSWRIERNWVRKHNFRVLYQKTPDHTSDVPNAPLFTDLARNDDERELLHFFHSQVDIARSFLAPPGVPADRVSLLRTAFVRMTKDPALLTEAKTLNLNLDILSGQELQKVVEDASNISDRLLKKAIEVSQPQPEGP